MYKIFCSSLESWRADFGSGIRPPSRLLLTWHCTSLAASRLSYTSMPEHAYQPDQTMMLESDEPPTKRRRLSPVGESETESEAETESEDEIRTLDLRCPDSSDISTQRAISPPALLRRAPVHDADREAPHSVCPASHSGPKAPTSFLPSPIQLTRIRDLPAKANVDSVSLSDILGDPLIKECWQFNYLFDIEFLM